MRLIDMYNFKETQRHMRETRIGNTFSKFTAIHRLWRKLHGGICRYKTFYMRVFARRTFLPLDIVVYMLKCMFRR